MLREKERKMISQGRSSPMTRVTGPDKPTLRSFPTPARRLGIASPPVLRRFESIRRLATVRSAGESGRVWAVAVAGLPGMALLSWPDARCAGLLL
jgi:hypothetical protein